MASEGVTQSPTQNTDATDRLLVTIAPRPAGVCYDEALVRAIATRLIFTQQENPLAGPVVRQVAPPSDKSAIWYPTDNSAGYPANTPLIWNGANWVPTPNQVSISGDENNAIFFDPSGALKVNLAARLLKEIVCAGPNPVVVVTWTAAEYSLGDEIPKFMFIPVGTEPAGPLMLMETARSSTTWNGKIIGLALGESVTLQLEFNAPMTKGD